MRRGLAGAIAAVSLWITASGAGAAQVTVGSGSSFDLGTGSLELGCSDLTVSGTFSAGSQGVSQSRDVNIAPGGVLNGNSATLEVAGNWSNSGSFNAGISTVQMVDGCGLSSAIISGNNTFSGLEMTTASGFQYDFTAGSTQTVVGALTLMGSAGNLLTIRSTSPGSAAFLDAQGSQSVDFVDVQDNHAISNPILLTAHSLKGPNTLGWTLVIAAPALSALGVALLAGLLVAGGRSALRGKRALGRRHLPGGPNQSLP